ncbi:MAG: hypothetical protein K6C12_10125 [Oscillospiraceae bacterium]|nr:hypothetical protein [Oscillospiraceae bacterium]
MEILRRNNMLRSSSSTAEVPDNIRFFQSNASSERTEDLPSDRKDGEWLRARLVSEDTLRKIKVLPKLFSKPVFFSGAILTLIWLLSMLIIYNPAKIATVYIELNAVQVVQWLIGVAVIAFIHECGHASAILHCGGNPGSIGISMRFLLPRGWSEVNEVWRLTEKERLLVDIGGIYIQLMFSAGLFVFNCFSGNSPVLLAICISSALMALINLTPNEGTDGYWMVKDAFGIEDLVQKAKVLFGRSSSQAVPNGKKEKTIVAILIVLRNIATIYLLVLILTVLISALKTVAADFVAIAGQIDPAAIIRILWNRLSCLVTATVALQNIIGSAGKTAVKKRSDLEEKGKVR